MKYRRRRRGGAPQRRRPRSSTLVRGRSARSPRRSRKYDVGAVLPAMGYIGRSARRDGEDHRRRRGRPRGDRHTHRPAPGDRRSASRRCACATTSMCCPTRRRSSTCSRRCSGLTTGADAVDGTGRGRAGWQRAAPARRRRHVRGDVRGVPRGRRAGRRYRRRRLAGGRHPRQRAAGRPHPPAAGGGRRLGAPDAARRLRCGEPGPDRVPAPGHDRRRVLRTRHGASGRNGAHAREGPRPTIPRSPIRRSSSVRTTTSRRPTASRPTAATR